MVMAWYGNNSLDPQAPEFGKAWKAEFNHGCCTTCGSETPPVCSQVISRITRTDQSESLVTTTEFDYDCPCQNVVRHNDCDCK
jgi:hypothetical protein